MSAQAAEIRIAFSANPGSLPLFVAQELGHFAAEGVTVQRVDCRVGLECLARLLRGEADLATTADLPLVLAAFKRQRFSVIATLSTSRGDTKIVARKSAGVRQTTDLAGRSVATLLGTTAQYALDAMLLMEGVDPKRVSIVGLRSDELRPALLGHRVDAVAVFEPLAFELSQALGEDAAVMGSRRAYTQSWNLIGPPADSGPRPVMLSSVLRALLRAAAWIASEPAAARKVLRRQTGMGEEEVDAAWAASTYGIELRQSLLSTLESQARWAQRRGMVSGPNPNFLDVIDPRPLQAVARASVPLAP